MLAEKIKFQWGYDIGFNDPEKVTLGVEGERRYIAYWPDANPPTIAEIEAIELPVDYQLVKLRNAAKAALADAKAESALLRAALLVIVDEFNNHADKINSILNAIDESGNISTLKTRIAAIADLPQRTGNQLRIAANNKLDAGNADT